VPSAAGKAAGNFIKNIMISCQYQAKPLAGMPWRRHHRRRILFFSGRRRASRNYLQFLPAYFKWGL
jgi:hypothetical protein